LLWLNVLVVCLSAAAGADGMGDAVVGASDFMVLIYHGTMAVATAAAQYSAANTQAC